MKLSLENKVALVTGGGAGIGQAIALRLAQSGAKVMIVARKEAELAETAALHENIVYRKTDITRSDELAATLAEIQRRFGRLDTIVNNAGVAPVTPLAEQSLDEFDVVFNVNVRAVLDLTRQALPLLKASHGAVINISSAVANKPLANMSVYSASKAALNTLTRVWAKELAADGIRVNSVGVGPIRTAIYDKTEQTEEERQQHIETVQRSVPLGRFGTPEEVANLVAFLASDQAAYLTGADYAVDGGFAS